MLGALDGNGFFVTSNPAWHVVLAEPRAIEGGTETILVAEDDDAVRAMSVELLTDLGYRVIQASDSDRALAIVNSDVHIDMLFTDVVMPGSIKCTDLAKEARLRLPEISVLFTSG